MIITNFYLAIMNRLMDANIGIVHFDLWNQQLLEGGEENDEEIPFGFPAVFIEYNPQEWVTLGAKKQQCELFFQLHICSEVMAETAHREGEPAISATLAHLNLIDNVFATLQGYSTTNIGTISRTTGTYSSNYRNIKDDVFTFKSLVTDTAAMLETTTASPKQKITI